MLVRLNKYIANTGYCARRAADELIAAGKVKINGQVITELGTKVEDTDPNLYITVNGKALKSKQANTYVVLNKPRGYQVTTHDPHAERTIYELLPGSLRHVLPVGRLDKESEGLLLLTNDGDVIQQYTHPSFKKAKVYVVTTKLPIATAELKQLAEGIQLEEGNTGKNNVKRLGETMFQITLHQGWNRQIRRMVRSVGHSVKRLQRIQVGKLKLGKLPVGKWDIVPAKDVIS